MNKTFNFFLVSDSTGETLDRIYLALKAQFPDNNYKIHHFAFMRTTTQTATLIEACKKAENPIILYTLVEKQTTNHIINECKTFNIPCFGLLDYLIPQFEKIFDQKATLKPSGQHQLNKEYYKKIEAMQFTLQHDDGQRLDTAVDADIVIFGVSRTSKTPTSIYLGERGYKVSNIPLVLHQILPEDIYKSKAVKVGLTIDPKRLSDVRKTRITILNDKKSSTYADISNIEKEIDEAKKLFNSKKIPMIDVTRKSVEESAASIIKIFEIEKSKKLMIKKVILASNSGIRFTILKNNNYDVKQYSSGVDEDEIKLSLIHNDATPLQIAKNLAELKANRVSSKFLNDVVIGADQTLDLNGKNIDKPKNLEDAKNILHNLNNQTHMLHSAICVSRAGSMISHFHDTCLLKMKKLSDKEISIYLEKIELETMLKYGVYQIEGPGKNLFEKIDGDIDSIQGLPMKQLKPYLDKLS